MNCLNCGAENSADSRFCIECGTPLNVPAPPEQGDDDETILSASPLPRSAPEESKPLIPETEEDSASPPLPKESSQPASDKPPPLAENPSDLNRTNYSKRSRLLFTVLGGCLTIIFFCICFAVAIVLVAAVSDPGGFEDLLRELSLVAQPQPLLG